jgi:hypothetical protein
MQANSKILKDIELYYSEKINSFGPTAQGVDWNSGQAQLLRFKQLCKVISNPEKPFSLTDLGCGYGALYSYLENSKYEFKYLRNIFKTIKNIIILYLLNIIILI